MNQKFEGVFSFPGSLLNHANVESFLIALRNWSINNRGVPLRLHFSCDGGNISDALNLYGQLQWMRSEGGGGHYLTIVIYGRQFSCGSWLLQVADKRVMHDEAWLQIHEITSAVTGTVSKIRQELQRCEQLQEQTNSIFCSRSKGLLTPAMILEKINDGKDWYIKPQEALSLKLIDAVEASKPYACDEATNPVAQ